MIEVIRNEKELAGADRRTDDVHQNSPREAERCRNEHRELLAEWRRRPADERETINEFWGYPPGESPEEPMYHPIVADLIHALTDTEYGQGLDEITRSAVKIFLADPRQEFVITARFEAWDEGSALYFIGKDGLFLGYLPNRQDCAQCPGCTGSGGPVEYDQGWSRACKTCNGSGAVPLGGAK